MRRWYYLRNPEELDELDRCISELLRDGTSFLCQHDAQGIWLREIPR